MNKEILKTAYNQVSSSFDVDGLTLDGGVELIALYFTLRHEEDVNGLKANVSQYRQFIARGGRALDYQIQDASEPGMTLRGFRDLIK